MDAAIEIEWEFDGELCHLHYKLDDREYTGRIPLAYTPCNYGGQRAWFICPSCSRRVGKLYLPTTHFVWDKGERLPVWWWKCRHCWGLTYEQRQAHDLYWCYNWRAERIAERWLGEISKDWIAKKKGQHQRTFERRADQYEKALAQANAAFLSGFSSTQFGRRILEEVHARREAEK